MKVGFGLCATTVVWAAILALGGFVWIRDEFGMRAATGAILLTVNHQGGPSPSGEG